MKKFSLKKTILYFLRKIKFSIKYIFNKNLEANIYTLKYSTSIIHIEKILKGKLNPIILDVGSHRGETINKILLLNKNSILYCFEPSKSNYKFIKNKYKKMDNIHIFNIGLGNKKQIAKFYENKASPISSFKKLDLKNQIESSWGIKNIKYSKVYNSSINTIDSWLKEKSIKKIDILKIDVQGSELDVIKGSKETLNKGIIKYILLEIIFVRVYENQPKLSEIYSILGSYNYKLNAIVDSSYSKEGELLQADFIFVLEK